MYGLLLEAIVHYIVSSYGEDKWEEIRKLAKLETVTFSTHKRYSETIIPDIAIACSELLDRNVDDIMDAFGVCFVSFVGQYGYDRILKVLGRNMRDFLNGLDNLHEYLRFSYPKLRPPSFFCTNETKTGLTLHYRSKRRGFLHYVKGQIRQVGRLFYGIKVDIDVVSIETSEELTHVVFRLHFDNTAYKDELLKMQQEASKTLPIDSNVFFDLFPFHLVFNRSFDLRNVGSGISAILPSATGMKLDKLFTLIRPLIDFSWMEILGHTNSVFELRSNAPLKRCTTGIYLCTDFLQDNSSADSGEEKKDNGMLREPEHTVFQGKDLGEIESSDDDDGNFLHLKGQMMYMREWECIIFLGTPIMESLDAMFKTGLYINDLSMHDSSRDLVLAGTQQSAELKLALDQEQQKSKILEESMRKLDAEMKRTDSLLYQMIPKPVADRLRRGEPAITTCQVFDNVTILFSDVVGFTNICSQISPMEVVSMLNAMYTKFDHLSERHSVYKVETIGDAYMVVSGAPEVTKYHAINICNMALDMMESMMDLKDPSTGGHMQIRVGVHSGTTVAGVVGIKMPRYCLFGDTVNIASRMETNGEAMKIHISQTTRESLTNYPYVVEERGSIPIKGKGSMKTYWLQGRDDKSIPTCPFGDIVGDLRETPKSGKGGGSLDLRSLYSPVSFDDVQRSKTPVVISTPVHRGNSRINLYSEDKPDSISKDKANGETVVATSNDKEFNYESNCKSITDVVKYSSRDRIRVSRFSNEDKSATCCLL